MNLILYHFKKGYPSLSTYTESCARCLFYCLWACFILTRSSESSWKQKWGAKEFWHEFQGSQIYLQIIGNVSNAGWYDSVLGGNNVLVPGEKWSIKCCYSRRQTMMHLHINHTYSKQDHNVVLGSNENDPFPNFPTDFFWQSIAYGIFCHQAVMSVLW